MQQLYFKSIKIKTAARLATHSLVQGVLVGVVLAAQFFASTEGFVEGIDFHEHAQHVELDLTDAHVWDGSAIAAIDKVILKLRAAGSEVKLIGLNEASATLHEKLATHHKGAPLNAVAWH